MITDWVTATVMRGPRGSKNRSRLPALTPRQVDVVRLMARGFTNQMMAKELGIRVYTVRRYRRDLLAALDAHTSGEAVARYLLMTLY
jgi:DNA-binding NarL/FixJ family response regulator